METKLTKSIKQACHFFKPALNTKMRTIRYADEVWTPTGIVDSIRFEDYIREDKSVCSKQVEPYNNICLQRGDVGTCKDGSVCNFSEKKCHRCVFAHRVHILDMLVTCYEIKVTVSDFKSNNGHNFHGNKNYYVVSSNIYEKIKDLVPNDIGIIVYYENTGYMKLKKECEFKEIDYELKSILLYNALKKWVDKS